MKHPIPSTFYCALVRVCQVLMLIFHLTCEVSAQELTWDANTITTEPQNGLGVWNTSSNNWWDVGTATNTSWVNSVSSIANIGVVGGSVASQNVLTVATDIQLNQLNFRAISTTTPVSLHQYSMNGDVAGRVLDFGVNGLIQVENFASGGSQFIGLGTSLRLKGENLKIQKYGDGTAFQFMTLSMTTNPELTGPFTLGGSIYAGFNPNTMPAISRVVVEAGGSAAISTSGVTHTVPFHLAGFGNSLTNSSTSYGAIRMTGSNSIYSGGIVLTANAGVNTSSSGGTNATGMTINGPITDGGNNFEFHRFAFGGEGTLTLSAANTYGGATVLGRQVNNYAGSVTILDFSAVTAPANDILYHGLTEAGDLRLFGGTSPSVLKMTGAMGQANSQRLGDLFVGGTHTALDILAGEGGSVDVTTGMLSRENNLVTLSITQSGAGNVTLTGMPNGFVGPWMSYSGPHGQRSWGLIEPNGRVRSGYAGEVIYTEGVGLENPAYGASTNINLSSASSGVVTAGVGTTFLNTLSMSDGSQVRSLALTTGKTLRLGVTGGIQLLSDAQSLTVGTAGDGGILSAGGPLANTIGTLFLSNHSSTSSLTVGANIANNGTGVVTVVVNGAPGAKTVLTGTNTHTGGTRVTGGLLEIHSNGALGTTGTVSVVEGSVASFALGGGVTLSRPVSIGGTGDGNLGIFRSVDGVNTQTGLLTMLGHSLITADAGSTLTFSGATAATSVISGTYTLTLGGQGTITVNGRLNLATAGLVKVGNGILNLGGDHIYTGATTVSGGTLQLMPGLTSTTASISVGAGASLSLNGVATNRPLTLNGNGFLGMGALHNQSATSATITGTVALAATTKVGGIGHTTISNTGGITGNVLLTKVDEGTLTVISTATSARTGVNQIDGGVLRLQALTAIAPVGTGTMALNGGTLSLGFDVAGIVGGPVNMLSNSTLITDRATVGVGGYALTLGALSIGQNTLTVKAGSSVESGTMGLTLGTTTIGGPSTVPGNPVFDVQSSATATTVLTLGALTDQSISPRTITFQNSGSTPSVVNLPVAATSLVNGTLVNLAAGGAPIEVNLNLAGALGSLAQVDVGSGNKLTLGASQTLGSLTGKGTVGASGVFTLTLGNANNISQDDTQFSVVLNNGTGTLSLTKLSKNTLTLEGAVSNTFTGLTTVSAGTLVLAKSGGVTALGGNLTVGNAASATAGLATVRLEGSNQLVSTASVAVNAGATLDLNGHDLTVGLLTSILGGTITGTGNTLTASASGGTFTSNGISHLYANYQMTGTVAATRTISVTSSTDVLTIHGDVTQGAFNGAIIKTGTGTLALSGNNTYTGTTAVSTGMLNIRSANALGTTAAGTSVAAGATLQIQGDIITAAETLTLNGTGFIGVGGVGAQNGALVNVSGSNRYAGLILLGSAATIASDSGSLSLTNPGTITGAGFGLTLTGAGQGRVDSIIGTTTGGLVKTGAGTWVLAGANTNSGTTTVANGTLQLGDGITGSWTSSPGLTFMGTGRFHFQGVTTGSSQTLGALTFGSGDGRVQSSYGGVSGDTSLVFTSLAARSVGATGNFMVDGGLNGSTNKIVLTGQPLDGFINQGLFFGGDAYAWYDAGGFVRGLDYLTDTGAVTSGTGLTLVSSVHQQVTGSITAQETVAFSTLNLQGTPNLTLADAQTVTVNGLLKTGIAVGESFISGGIGIQAGLNAELVIRTDETADSLTIATPILANGINALTKSGAGKLLLASINSYTGPTHVAAGTLQLGSGGTLTTSLIAVSTGGVLDLNDQMISNGVSLNGAGFAGTGSLINSGSGSAKVGGITLVSSSTIGGAGDIVSTGVLAGLSPIQLLKVGTGTVTFGDNAGVALASVRTGLNQIDAGVIRISNSPSALGTVAAQLVLNGGKISLGSATTVVAYPTAVTANSGIESDAYTAGAGLVHTLGTLAIGSHTLTVTAGSNITTEGTNAGVTFGATTLRGNPIFDVQSPTTSVLGTTTLTLGALNDQGNAKTLTLTNNGTAPTPSVVTLAVAAGSLMEGTIVNVGGGAHAGVTLNLNAATALGTLAQVSLDEKSTLNLGAAQTIASLSGTGTVSASGAFVLTVGNVNSMQSSPTAQTEFTASLINGTGTLGFTKGGLGTLTLNPALSSYTGVTTVIGGVLKLGHANALGLTSGVTIGVESTVDLNGQSTDRNFSSIRGVGYDGMGAIINSSSTTSTITGTAVLASFTKMGGSGNITFNNVGGLIGNTLLTKFGTGTLTFISTTTSGRSGVNQLDEGVLRLEAATGIRPVGVGVMALNGGTLSLGFDGSGSVGGAVNLLSNSTIVVDRMTEGAEDLVLSLGVLGIGGNTLTVKAGNHVTGGTVGLTLGTTTIGGPALAPGNPIFDVQSSSTAVTNLRLGALTDQAIAPRTITFQNSGEAGSVVTLALAATSLVNGTLVNLADTGAPVRLNLDITGALGQLSQVTVASGNTLALGASQTLAGLNGAGSITSSAVATLTLGNALSPVVIDSTFNGVIEGAGDLSVVKAGLGTLTLGGATSNTFSGAGGMMVSGGTLVLAKTLGAIAVPTNLTVGSSSLLSNTTVRLGGDHQIATTSKVTLNRGATLDLNGFNQNFGNLFGLVGSVIVNNGTGTHVTVTLGLGDATGNAFAGDILDHTVGTGTLAISKVGTGTLTLMGSNQFSGPVSVTGGELAFVNGSNLGNGVLGNTISVSGGSTLSYLASGATVLGINQVLTLGSGGATVNVAEADGTLTLAGGVNPFSTGNLSKSGSGRLVLPGTTDLSGTVLTVDAGVLQAGFGTDGISALTVGATGGLDLSNGSTQALSGLTGLTLTGGSRVGFELDTLSHDSLAAIVAASVTGTIVLDFFNVGDGVAATTYPLITAPSGLLGGTYMLGQSINGWNLAINTTDTVVSVVATKLQLVHWRGGQDSSWSTLGADAANWTLDSAGLVDATQLPGFADTLVFSAATAPFDFGNEIITALDAPFLVEGLIFDSSPEMVSCVNIHAGTNGELTLKPLSSSGGIEVRDNAGIVTLSTPVITGDSQVWKVSATGASLVLEGNVTFNHQVTKVGAGALTLSGQNTGSGGLQLLEGRLNLNSATALGMGTFTLANGTVIDNTSAAPVSLSTHNEQVWNGSFSYRGTQGLNLGTGDVRISQNVIINTEANTLEVGGMITDGVGVFGLGKTGLGTLILAASNIYQGATILDQGRLIISADQNLLEGSNTLMLGAEAGSSDAFVLDLSSASVTLGGDTLVQTQDLLANEIIIGEGQTLKVLGGFAMGYNAIVETTTKLAILGGGTFKLGDFGAPNLNDVQIGNGTSLGVLNASVLDLSGLAAFYANLGAGTTFSIGDTQISGGSPVFASEGSRVSLAPNSTLIAETVSIGGSTLATQSLKLGVGSNALFANSLLIGGPSSSGHATLDFLGANGSLVLRDLAGTGRVNMQVQNGSSTSVTHLSGLVDLRGHDADLLLGTLAVGGRSAGTVGHGEGTFHFDTGNLDVTTIDLSTRSGGAQTSSVVTGILSLGGQTPATTVTVGTLNMSTNVSNSVDSSGEAISILNLTGTGAININTLNMGLLALSGVSATGGTVATINSTASHVTIGSINMAVNASSDAVLGSTQALSTLNISAGRMNVTGDIHMGGTSVNALNHVDNLIVISDSGSLVVGGNIIADNGIGIENVKLRLAGGALDMMGGTIGTALVPISVELESGTVRNWGEINGGSGVTKMTSGVVVVEGTNHFEGLTVASGLLQFSTAESQLEGWASLETDVVFVTGGGILGGIGSLKGDVQFSGTVEESAILRPGLSALQAGREVFHIEGALTLGVNSRVEFQLGQTSFTAVEVETLAAIDASVRFGFALENGYVPAAGASFHVLKWASGAFDPLHDWSANFDLPTPDGYTWDITDFTTLGIVRVVGAQLPPVVAIPPQTTTANAGDSVILSVVLMGSEAWLIQWMKDEVDIPGANGLSYVIDSSSIADAGVYKVRVINEFGSTESLGGLVSIRTSPVFESHPLGGEAIDGAPYTFVVNVLGPQPFTYLWKKDGITIEGAPNAPVYTINPIRKVDHEGVYTVEVSNSFGDLESDPAELTVRILIPASITQDPQPASVPEGNLATFEVVAAGDAPLSYQWRRNGVAIVDGPNFTGTNTATLQVLANLTTASASGYSVVVSGVGAPVGSAEAALTLAPVTVVITEHPLSQTIGVGTAINLSVTSTGGFPQTFQWRQNGKILVGATGSSLVIPAASLTSAGAYDCIASNNLATGRSSATSLAAQVVVVDQSPKQYVIRELSASPSLSVSATGNGIHYQWYVDVGGPGGPDFQEVSGATSKAYRPGTLEAGSNTFFCRVTGLVGFVDGGFNEVLVYNAGPEIVQSGNWGLPPTTVSAPYSFKVPLVGQSVDAELGGTGVADANKIPVSFRAKGLPAGLTLNSQGIISGRATVDGSFEVTLSATNAFGSSSYGPVALIVSPLGGNVIGQFTGLVDRSPVLSGGLGGSINVLTTKKGTYSGRATLGAKTYAFKGVLDPSLTGAAASVLISRGKGLTPLTLTFVLNQASGLIERSLSSITDGSETAAFGGWRHTWQTVKGAPPAAAKLAGYYTVGLTLDPALQGTSLNMNIPQGTGYAAFTVAPTTGKLNVVGRLADGTAFTTATFAGPNGEVMVFRALYLANARGSVIGEFKIDNGMDVNGSEDNTLQGSLSWWRPATPSLVARLYRAGFGPIELEAVGGRYVVPLATDANPRVMSLDASLQGIANAVVELTEARIESAKPLMTAAQPNTAEFRVDEKNKALATDPLNNLRAVTLSINAKTGGFTGRFVLRDVHPYSGGKPDPIIRTVIFQGMIVTGGITPLGVGHYLLPQHPSGVMENYTATPILSGRVVFDRP